MARKGWDSLSPGYRARLERGGITKSAYQSGASIKGARGHAHTPENPKQAEKHPERFTRYVDRRQNIAKDIKSLKQRMYGSSPKWNQDRANKNVTAVPDSGRQRGIRELENIYSVMVRMADDGNYDWNDYSDDLTGDDESAFYYH